MALKSLHDLYVEELRDIYDAENQILQSFPRIAQSAKSQELRRVLEEDLNEAKNDVQQLEQIFNQLQVSPQGKRCAGMQGVIEESKQIINMGLEPAVQDAALIAATQKAEHYEIASFGTVRTYADMLGYDKACDILQHILDEKKRFDKKLTEIAESKSNVEAIQASLGPGWKGTTMGAPTGTVGTPMGMGATPTESFGVGEAPTTEPFEATAWERPAIGLFENYQDAERAVDELKSRGFSMDEISVVASDQALPESLREYRGEPVARGAGTGALGGAAVGTLGGLLLGVSGLAIPGIGPVIAAGSLASIIGSTLAGAGIGAALGGLAGALANLGVPKEEAEFYAKGVERGGVLVTVHTTDEERMEEALDVMEDCNAVDVEKHRKDWL